MLILNYLQKKKLVTLTKKKISLSTTHQTLVQGTICQGDIVRHK